MKNGAWCSDSPVPRHLESTPSMENPTVGVCLLFFGYQMQENSRSCSVGLVEADITLLGGHNKITVIIFNLHKISKIK